MGRDDLDWDNLPWHEPAGPRSAPRRLPPVRPERGRRWPRRLGFATLLFALVGSFVLTGAGRAALDRILPEERLRPAPEVLDSGGSYAFLATQRGSDEPVTYDPCDRIEVRINPDGGPPGGTALIEEAVAQVARASGLALEIVGTTDDRPSRTISLNPFAGQRTGASGVLVAWSTPDEVPELAGRVAGLGGSTALRDPDGGRAWFVGGQVAMDGPTAAEILDRPNGVAELRAILLHELAHVVGLGHVKDRGELMAAENTGRIDFGPGDIEGLALVGSGPCR